MSDFIDRHLGMFFFLAVSAIFSVPLALCLWFDKTDCQNYGTTTNRPVTWLAIGGCFVKTSKGYMPRDEFKARAIMHEQ